MPSEGPTRALARVDLGAVERNCRRLRSALAADTELMAVVKADGYGHGAVACAHAALAGGATWLGTATAEEAVELRRHDIDARVLVQGALAPADCAVAIDVGAEVVVWRREQVRGLAEQARETATPVRVHVKLDTGMGRLGTAEPTEALAVAELVAADARLELAGVMTHFATADEPGDGHFPSQLAAFASFVERVRAAHPGVIAHAANSAATLRDPAAHFDLVRCGIAVYGLDPFHGDAAERGLEPALSLESYLADVKQLDAGQSAGYGRRFVAHSPTWIGVLPIGYGDGVRRGLSNNADVLVDGRRHPLVGTVSMDNVTIDLGPETTLEPGARAVLIGAQGGERLSCEEMATRLGTINYEVTCGLSARVRRAYERS